MAIELDGEWKYAGICVPLDNAKYHVCAIYSREYGAKPRLKHEYQQWLQDHGNPFVPSARVVDLKAIFENSLINLSLNKLVLEEICEKASQEYGIPIEILRLPPYILFHLRFPKFLMT